WHPPSTDPGFYRTPHRPHRWAAANWPAEVVVVAAPGPEIVSSAPPPVHRGHVVAPPPFGSPVAANRAQRSTSSAASARWSAESCGPAGRSNRNGISAPCGEPPARPGGSAYGVGAAGSANS